MDAPLTHNAARVLERRYLRRDADGRVLETPGELWRRVARTVAAVDARHGADPRDAEARFLGRMARLEFLPNSPTLMNAGREGGQLAACFVVPVGDSMVEIFDAIKWAALIQMTGGGTGFSFSRLRPAGDRVASTGGVASGPLAFLDVFNAATDAVKQGGTRRGANMGLLRVDHPDILDFVAAKLDPRRFANFNLSVGVTDAFMDALERDAAYELRNPRTGQATRTLPAREVFDRIVASAWRTGDPGLVFLDRVNAAHPTPEDGEIETTNPCGEQPLLPFESCVLGSVNVARFVGPPAGGGDEASIDWPALGEAIRDAVHFLDNVIDAGCYPLPQIEAITRRNRKIGLGVMGLADLLLRLGVPYDSERALEVAGEIAAFLERASLAASVELARARGPFPGWARSRPAAAGAAPRRNATTTTIAPTGTISILAGCSSGIEPLYAVAYVRRALEGERLVEVHPLFEEAARRAGSWTPRLEAELLASGGVRGLAGVPEPLQRLFVTAHEIAPEAHVRMQAVFQRRVHAAVSKTVNLPERAPPDAVARVYRLAHELGCKGVTVYRDRSRDAQVLVHGAGEVAPAEAGLDARDDLRGGAGPSCPACGRPLEGDGGCAVCRACGWSRCG